MAYMKEKVAYLRGLAEGMNIGEEGMGKLVNAMIASAWMTSTTSWMTSTIISRATSKMTMMTTKNSTRTTM